MTNERQELVTAWEETANAIDTWGWRLSAAVLTLARAVYDDHQWGKILEFYVEALRDTAGPGLDIGAEVGDDAEAPREAPREAPGA